MSVYSLSPELIPLLVYTTDCQTAGTDLLRASVVCSGSPCTGQDLNIDLCSVQSSHLLLRDNIIHQFPSGNISHSIIRIMSIDLVPGKYQLTESDNFENFMARLGIGYLTR